MTHKGRRSLVAIATVLALMLVAVSAVPASAGVTRFKVTEKYAMRLVQLPAHWRPGHVRRRLQGLWQRQTLPSTAHRSSSARRSPTRCHGRGQAHRDRQPLRPHARRLYR